MGRLLHPRYWGAHLLMVLALVASILLGLWQMAAWQAQREAEARDVSDARPIALATVMTGDSAFPGRALGRPVTFEGTWMPQSTLFVADRHDKQGRGYWVVTPVLIGESAMPVVRGYTRTPKAALPEGKVAVTGWLQAGEGQGNVDPDPHDDVITSMRIASIVEHVDADLYSGYVVAREVTPDTASEGLTPVTAQDVPAVSSTTALRNLLYGVQWWLFGAFAVFIWWRWCRDTLEVLATEEQVASSA